MIYAAEKTLISSNGQRYTDQGIGVQKKKKREWTRRTKKRIAEKRAELGWRIASEEDRYHSKRGKNKTANNEI